MWPPRKQREMGVCCCQLCFFGAEKEGCSDCHENSHPRETFLFLSFLSTCHDFQETSQGSKENDFQGPRGGPPTTPGQELTSTGMSSRFRLTDKGCGLNWASVSSRNALRACWAGESLESRAASLGNLFCLFWGTGRGAV